MVIRFQRLQLFAVCTVILTTFASGADRAAAQPMRCEDPGYAVTSADPDLSRRVCREAADIGGRLAACGLVSSETVVIEITDVPGHLPINCLAYYDCEHDVVRVTDPALFPDLLAPDNPYAQLSPEAVLRALLTHEVSHVLVARAAAPRSVSIIDQEYVAAAMELDLLDPGARAALLEASPTPDPPSAGLIDIWIYGLEPRKFAANAWQHFALPENGCDLVRRIVDGKFSFAGKH